MKFDYKGYSEEELLDLCTNSKNIIYTPFPNKYIGTEFYSFSTLIKQFAYFPAFLPLRICYDHGYSPYKELLDEQKEECNTRFVFQKWRENLYKPYYKQVKTLLLPYIYYRCKHDIIKKVDAKGTLIFVSHDYAQTEENFSNIKKNEEGIKDYIKKIKALPDIYKPICVCLHVNDVRYTKLHKYYLEAGIPVYTAGHERDIRFVKRYYDILKNFKYTMAPKVGSATLYSLDLGIPFAILKNDNNITYHKDIEEANSLFENPFEKIPKITQPQIEFFVKNTGYNDSISRLECARIVWGSFFKYICTKEAWQGFGKVCKNLTNRKFYKSVIECIKL